MLGEISCCTKNLLVIILLASRKVGVFHANTGLSAAILTLQAALKLEKVQHELEIDNFFKLLQSKSYFEGV